MGKRTDFLYLSEPDVIKAGVLDAGLCVNNAEEVFRLIAKGDYVMGGPNHNSHGIYVTFPKEPEFEGMPADGPDRRFVAMPAYIGGRFGVAGCKFYGSNAANKKAGLPRSILMTTLNNRETGEPICYMSGNLISAARTGAVPAVGVRHLARKDASVLTLVGCGAIGKSCLQNIVSEMPNLKRVICHNHSEGPAVALAEYCTKTYGIEAVVENDLETATRQADVLNVAASRTVPLIFDSQWIKPGCTILASGPLNGDEAFWLNMKIVWDNHKLHEAYVEDAIISGDREAFYKTVIGGPIFHLIDEGKIPALDAPESTDIGDVINGKKTGRESDDQIICFIASGMAIFDVALGFDLYNRALELGLGTPLLLWESPEQAG